MNVPFAAVLSSIGCCASTHGAGRSLSGSDGHVRTTQGSILLDTVRSDIQRGLIALSHGDRGSAISAFECATVTHRHRLLVWRILAQLRPELEFNIIADEITAAFLLGYLATSQLDCELTWTDLRMRVLRVIKEL